MRSTRVDSRSGSGATMRFTYSVPPSSASRERAGATVTPDRPVAPGERVVVSYNPPRNNPIRAVAVAEGAAFSGRPATNVAPASAVTGVAVISNAGDDDTCALGETIRVRLTFGEKVAVDTTGGKLRVKIKMDPRWASSGRPTRAAAAQRR